MDAEYAITDLRGALAERLYPTITLWNRLEGRPRRAEFDRALRAEVRDALWMLSKQWQIGEFIADDAGSPVLAKLRMRRAPVTKYKAGEGPVQPFEPDVPLEAKAEQRRIQWTWNEQKMRFDLRAQLGRRWNRMLADAGLGVYRQKYRSKYPFTLPAQDEAAEYVYAHPQAWQQYAALAGRAVDGGDLYVHISGGGRASDGIALNTPADGGTLDGVGTALVVWFDAMYYQPNADAAWKPPYLEYQFACSVPGPSGEQVLTADEYPGGDTEWYAFDRKGDPLGGAQDPGEVVNVSTFIPTPIAFQGMPDPRWWSLEDRKTDFGAVKPSTTDLAQLLLMEFALVYADDWFVVPFRLPAATLAQVDGMAVTNTFGERFWITPGGTGPEQDWHRWSMFQLSGGSDNRSPGVSGLFIPPSAATLLDGEPFEEVEMVRDEVANMVWAVERMVPSLTGRGRFGKEEAHETHSYHTRLVAAGAPAPPEYAAPIAYLAMTEVPEHFIPFVPVHVPGSNREIQLQRSRLLRIIEGDPLPPSKVPPRTTLVRQGLDDKPQPHTYFVHEEEVPRDGIRVTQRFRRTRWTNGQVYVWIGARKQTGRGERSSGLAFDTIVPAKSNP